MTTPNRFELSGGRILAGYATTGINGKAHLSYHRGAVSKAFVGPDWFRRSGRT